jgi:hypothetical protein
MADGVLLQDGDIIPARALSRSGSTVGSGLAALSARFPEPPLRRSSVVIRTIGENHAGVKRLPSVFQR